MADGPFPQLSAGAYKLFGDKIVVWKENAA
jgi:hypothetical protein